MFRFIRRLGQRRARSALRPLLTVGIALGALLACAGSLHLLEPLPLEQARQTSRLVLDRNGALLRAFTTEDKHWRLKASVSDVSPNYIALLLAFEDKRFRTHFGVDPIALGRAVVQSAKAGRIVSGGSTLTMQVARLLRGSPTRSLTAKAQQIADAFRLEAAFTKDEILSLYLTLAPFGGNVEGVRAASLAYLGKEPGRLTAAEAAMLVAIPQSPEARRPDRDRADLLTARNRVLARGLAAGAIPAAEARYAELQRLPASRESFPALAAHLADRLAAATPDAEIKTTIIRDVQASAEAIVRRHALALGDKLSAAAIIIDHTTGDVVAHVGSPGYFDEGRFGAIDMTAAVRSPGSALKPFIYGLGFEDGLIHPETLIEDRPVRFDHYAPANFDKTFHGTVSIRQALQLSLNVPAVKVLYQVGPAKLSARFRAAGLPIGVPRNLTVALGGTGLTLEQLAQLYASLARGGEPVPLRFREGQAQSIGCPTPQAKASVAAEDETSETVSRAAPCLSPSAEPPRLLTRQAAWYVADILRGAAPPNGAMPGMVAFKTGTSYGYRDAWSAGFDGRHTIAVWVGRPDGSSTPGLMGLKAAAPILFDLFQALGPRRAPFAGPPANTILVQQSQDLPPPLRAFPEPRVESATPDAPSAPPLRIAYPLPNSEIELDPASPAALVAKAEGGALPLTWLVNGEPVRGSLHRRDITVAALSNGFVQLTVIDANGRSDRTQVRVRTP
jgi:penicillin-binding protein 1C